MTFVQAEGPVKSAEIWQMDGGDAPILPAIESRRQIVFFPIPTLLKHSDQEGNRSLAPKTHFRT